VAELSDGDIWEIYTLKTALYTLAAVLAIDKLTAAGVEKLEKIVGQMEALVAGGKPDIVRYEDLNNQFHDATALIAGHGRLKKIQQSINNQVKRMAYRSLADPRHLEQSCRYHREILDAIKARDKARAEALTREHIQRGMAVQAEMKTDSHGDPPDPKRTKEALHAAARSKEALRQTEISDRRGVGRLQVHPHRAGSKPGHGRGHRRTAPGLAGGGAGGH
jgi:hypothetical protein